MKKKNLKNYIKILVIIMICVTAHKVFAAKIIVNMPQIIPVEGESFPVTITLDPEGVSVNTLSLNLVVPEGVEIKSVIDTHSIIALWLKKPQVGTRARAVEISGIIPGGFSGLINPFSPKKLQEGEVIKLMMIRHSAADAIVRVQNVHAYQDDGLGTEIPISIEMTTTTGQSDVVPTKDIVLPESFVPEIIHDSLIGNGNYTVVFATQDKLSGMDHFEIKQGDGSWQTVESPYVIENKNLVFPLLVKAVDRAGNARIVAVDPIVEPVVPAHPQWTVIMSVVAIVIAVLFMMYMRKSKRQ